MINLFLNIYGRYAHFNKLTAKIFLTAYVVSGYSTQIFSNNNLPVEKNLHAAANSLIYYVKEILVKPDVNAQPEVIRKFNRSVVSFYDSFILYKKYDSQIKINELIQEWCNIKKVKDEILISTAYLEEEKKSISTQRQCLFTINK